jgi:uncharacterized repeat protein (TIGR01451 family)/CSLREA domain-containing protein
MQEQTQRTYALWLALAPLLVLAVWVLLLTFPAVETQALAVTLTVTTTDDEYDTSGTGNGCSLREAIEAVNTGASFGGCDNASGTVDTILVPAGIYILTRLTGGTWDNTADSLYIHQVNLDIQGDGPDQTIISTTASFADSVFKFYASNTGPVLHGGLKGMTVQGGNAAGSGGGIYVVWYPTWGGTTFSLSDVVVRNNSASQDGGGIYLQQGPTVTFSNVAISDNKAQNGGGVYFSTRYMTDSLRIVNSTISGNEAQNSGGGLYANYAGYSPTTVRATNVTFSGNSAVAGSGGNIYNKQSTVSLANTIVTGGTDSGGANNCAGDPVAAITSLGYNLDSGNTCGLSAAGDLTGTNPLLDPLGDYGGGTLTHRLPPTSPALDRIPQGTSGCGTTVTDDQRGVPRPQPSGGACDVGAFELMPADLSINKLVTPDTAVAEGGIVTYTIVLSNSSLDGAGGVVLTDSLPANVDFAWWVEKPAGAAVANDVITWTGPVTGGTSLTFGFVVTHTGGYGDVVDNTAVFSAAVGGGGSSVATFVVEGSQVYLPLITRDMAAQAR